MPAEARAPRKQAPARKKRPDDIARSAAEHLATLAGAAPERTIALERDDDDGWRVSFEVVEIRRVPETMDVLAVYEVAMSPTGALRWYRRTNRYQRGHVQDMS